ncbi:MAG TPA: UDP-N-acetylmuramoyl-tripeptide--D-alanyl-D-alanine ligase [Thermomicrobiales bacterium]|nr:UDP-N-acetylmuramoyl-tripeptide--D-alanyl-D-alanine ligase [Thermomicrobiales bacterium]
MTAFHPLDLPNVLVGTGGRLVGVLSSDTRFRAVERDARAVQPGDLFVAIEGERFDGHAFVADAAANGAAAALVRRSWASEHGPTSLPLMVVPDEPVGGLQRLARWWRERLSLTVVGITGSVGKTSVKEVAGAILARRFVVYKSPGNLNNEIGLPLSLLETTPETEVAVLEMGGAYAFGDLTLLASIAHPKVGLVLNIHPVHLERMGTIEAIAETKAELVDALPADGIAVLNGDDFRVRAMAPRSRGRVLFFGLGSDNDVRATAVVDRGTDGVAFTLQIGDRAWPVETPMVGAHAPMVALAGLATGHALGLAPDEMIPALADRQIQIRVRFLPGPGGSRLIDDTYNASPPSVLSALGVLAASTGRRVAVLGDMRELGDRSEQEHRAVGRRAAEIADLVVTLGDEARVLAHEAGHGVDGRGPAVASFGADEKDDLTDFLRRELGAGDVVLLKGSRGLRMETVVAALAEPPPAVVTAGSPGG